VLHNSTADADTLAKVGCYCDNGVFLGWGTWLPYAALATGVVYSWLTGKAGGGRAHLGLGGTQKWVTW